MQTLRWGGEALAIEISWSADSAPRLSAAFARGVELAMPAGLPLIEVLAVGHGHTLASDRLVHSSIGHSSRYSGHTVSDETLALTVIDPVSRLESVLTLTQHPGVA